MVHLQAWSISEMAWRCYVGLIGEVAARAGYGPGAKGDLAKAARNLLTASLLRDAEMLRNFALEFHGQPVTPPYAPEMEVLIPDLLPPKAAQEPDQDADLDYREE
ncbi:hypothetical protein ENBRE01_3019 [Enteropsectra breve]|nr:hypothetical protein ENBRE01_3019 [Enteropsectra breve]